jgi:hypothetical protein
MYWVPLFFIQLLILFFLSKNLIKQLSFFMYRITHSKKITVHLLALLFLPGTIIHELSHYCMARILFVHAGNIRLFPELEGDEVKLGTVQISKTDPIRRFLIGAAPFFFGTLIIIATIYSSLQNHVMENTILFIAVLYCVFEVGNSMFSSKKDMEGALELFVLLSILILFLYIVGVRAPDVSYLLTRKEIVALLQQANLFVSIPLIMDIVALFLLRIFHSFLR